MAWPLHLKCGTWSLGLGRRAVEITPAEVRVYRSYLCLGCMKILWTVETVFCEDAPTIHLGRKFATDVKEVLRKLAERFGHIPSPSREATDGGVSEEGVRTSGPRIASSPLPVEMRGIRRTA